MPVRSVNRESKQYLIKGIDNTGEKIVDKTNEMREHHTDNTRRTRRSTLKKYMQIEKKGKNSTNTYKIFEWKKMLWSLVDIEQQ